MRKRPFISVFTLILGLFLISCKKEKKVVFSYTEHLVSDEIKLQNSFWLNTNTGFSCGGIKSEKGKIFKTTNGGIQWNEVYSGGSRSLYDIYFINDTIGYCCGEGFTLLFTKDGGVTWGQYPFPAQPPAYDIVTLRHIYLNNNVMVISGGDNFNKGLVINFVNNSFTPYFSHRDAEIRSCLSFDNNNSFIVFGYGYAFRSKDTVKTFQPVQLTGDFFTGSCNLNNSTGYVCGYDGGIYQTSDGGGSWKKQLDVNRLLKTRIHLNAITFLAPDNGWCIGNNGVVLHSDNGSDWKKVEFNSTDDLLSIRKRGNSVVITSSKGKLYEFN